MTTRWFAGKELALALGINLAMARMGSVINDFVTPLLGVKLGVPWAIWIGTLSCILSLLCSSGLAFIDLTQTPDQELDSGEYIQMTSDDEIVTEDQDMGLDASTLTEAQPCEQLIPKQPRKNLWDCLVFPSAFWILQVILILMYATVVPFNTIHSAFLQTKWYKGLPVRAAQVMAIPDVISAVLVPFCGAFVDRYGYTR
ncbi:MAG: hypothetical protein SGCHY_001954 [Lobulomycetales sp.]